MNAWPSDVLLKTVLALMTFCCAALILRDARVIALHVPLDPNEGWNAYHATAAMAGRALYPHTLMTNNYPPLSFFIIGFLARITGDAIVAGRLVSLIAFLAIGIALAALLAQIGARVLDGLFAALFFGASLLIASDYVAMDDPEMMGHALQVAALLPLLREKPSWIWAALLLTAGLFIKHNLIALPLAATVWLACQDRGAGFRLGAAILCLGVGGLAVTRVSMGVDLPAELTAPRAWSFANMAAAGTRFAAWSAPAFLAAGWLARRLRHDRWALFCLLYVGISLCVAVPFSAGDGVDANIFFDTVIALALSCGLALTHLPPMARAFAALAVAAPLALLLGRNFADDNFHYTELFQRQAPIDIALLETHPGPALCESLALCYWAGKPGAVDVFNLSERFKTGAGDEGQLTALLQRRAFGIIQFDSLSPFAFSPHVAQSLRANYREIRQDENGVFLVPR